MSTYPGSPSDTVYSVPEPVAGETRTTAHPDSSVVPVRVKPEDCTRTVRPTLGWASAPVTLTATNDSSVETPVPFSGARTVLEVTGLMEPMLGQVTVTLTPRVG